MTGPELVVPAAFALLLAVVGLGFTERGTSGWWPPLASLRTGLGALTPSPSATGRHVHPEVHVPPDTRICRRCQLLPGGHGGTCES